MLKCEPKNFVYNFLINTGKCFLSYFPSIVFEEFFRDKTKCVESISLSFVLYIPTVENRKVLICSIQLLYCAKSESFLSLNCSGGNCAFSDAEILALLL